MWSAGGCAAQVAADGGRSRVCRKCGSDLGVLKRPKAAKATAKK